MGARLRSDFTVGHVLAEEVQLQGGAPNSMARSAHAARDTD